MTFLNTLSDSATQHGSRGASSNIPEGVVQQARKRLRKKLNLQQGESLSRFLREV